MKIRTPLHRWELFLGIGALFIGTAFLSLGALRGGRVFADDGKNDGIGSFVTIYDEGAKTIVKSADMTVREILESASIQIDEDSDIIEPALDTEVSGNTYNINIYRARPVLISDGAQSYKLMTASTVPTDVAAAAGISLFPEDIVKITTEGNFSATGISFSYQVVRAKLIHLDYYGTPVSVRTQTETIADFLIERDITLSADDWLSVSQSAKVTDGQSIALYRNGKSTIVTEEAIPFSERIIHDYNRPLGQREVTTPGQAGSKAVTYEIEMFAGQEVSRVQISEIVTKEPTEAVITVGQKVISTTSPSENEAISWKFLRAQGFSRNQTAGIMGNLMQEHGFKTSDARGGCGIVQWTAGRRAALMAKPNWQSIHTQLAFLMEELNGKYAGVKNSILASSSVEDSVRIFQNQFERCGKCNEPNRIKYAYEILWRHEE